MPELIHVIPVGGEEPLHRADLDCWCFPSSSPYEASVMRHNAKDCREAQERIGGIRITGNKGWILVKD